MSQDALQKFAAEKHMLTFLASAGGSYMASQAMQGQFQYMQS